jgi:hypothetical protein
MKNALLILLLAATPAMANRAIMENLAASNNAVFIDTPSASVNIDTITPITGIALNVGGAARFGTDVNVSTFSAGNLNVPGTTTSSLFSGAQFTSLAASSATAATQFTALAVSTTATAVQLIAVAAATTTAYNAAVFLTSTQTFSGANTFISTTIFQGPVQTSSLAYVSSFTFVPANSTQISATSLGVGIANSTVTFTSYVTSRHRVVINALMRGSDSATTEQCGILRNGKFFDSQGTGQGTWSMPSPSAPTYAYWSQTWISPTALSSGTYSYALTCATASGNVQFCSNGNSGLTSTCYIEAGEAKF